MVSIPSSHDKLTIDSALEMGHNLCQISYQFYDDKNFSNLHKSLKQLLRLYCDCKGARLVMGYKLLDLNFEKFAVKLLKRLNNSGIFKDDDIWFTTFYLYNILWNYSEANSKFSSGLISAGIETLLLCNISHIGYIENLSKNNVCYLIKSSLSIIHNILRIPGHRGKFNKTKVINSLVFFANREDVLGILATICLGFIACNENSEDSIQIDISSNLKTILIYLKNTMETGGKYNSFTMLDFVEIFRANSICELQKNTILDLHAIDIFIKCLKYTNDERVKINILWTLRNISTLNNMEQIRECIKENIFNETELVNNVAKCVLWKLDLLTSNSETIKTGKAIFINFSESDYDMALILSDLLSDLKKVPLGSYENDCEKLKKAYDEASIIIVCVSEAFKNSGNFVTGAEYCKRQKKLRFPVLVDKNYRMDGWLKEYVENSWDVCYNLSGTDDKEWSTFINDIKDHIIERLSDSDSESTSSFLEVSTTIINDDEKSNVFSLWLQNQNLSHLTYKLSSMTMDMMFSLKRMRADAPNFYFDALAKYLHFSFFEILQFDSALSAL